MSKLNEIKPIYIYGIGVIPLALTLPLMKVFFGNVATFVLSAIYFISIRFFAIRFGSSEKKKVKEGRTPS